MGRGLQIGSIFGGISYNECFQGHEGAVLMSAGQLLEVPLKASFTPVLLSSVAI